MPFPTQPAFVHHGTWDHSTRQHPAMKWMESCTLDFDTHTFPTKWMHPDCETVLADGSRHRGREIANEAIKQVYGPLAAHLHEPFYLVVTEAGDGASWDMIGLAMVYANLSEDGSGSGGEAKVKDLSGKEWDFKMPGAFKFHYVKDKEGPDGIYLRRSELCSDSGVPMKLMLKRGLIGAKDLGL
jgi:hypothetical protein